MTTRATLVAVAVALALAQLPTGAAAAASTSAASTTAGASAAAPARAPAPVAASAPGGWIAYDDATYTPVLDAVSQALADARSALAAKDNSKAAAAMTAAARALQDQAERAGTIDRQRAAADMQLARQTHARLVALTARLDATAAQIKAGKLPTTAALDKVLDKAARADLERRWLVTDVSTWSPVADAPQRHFSAAVDAVARQDAHAAATEVRKAAAYVRLESARAVGQARKGLDAADSDLVRLARALDKGTVKTGRDMHNSFADAEHALALAHRAKAAEAWAHKSYDLAGDELKASAQGLESATVWTDASARTAAMAGVSDARAVGDKLASGGVWAKDEVARGFESLGTALNHLGQSIGATSQAAPFDVGA